MKKKTEIKNQQMLRCVLHLHIQLHATVLAGCSTKLCLMRHRLSWLQKFGALLPTWFLACSSLCFVLLRDRYAYHSIAVNVHFQCIHSIKVNMHFQGIVVSDTQRVYCDALSNGHHTSLPYRICTARHLCCSCCQKLCCNDDISSLTCW